MTVAEQRRRKPSRVYLRRGHPLTRGLIAAYPFFEGSGGTLRDVSGRQNHGTVDAPAWTLGPRGWVLDFDGVDDFVDLGQPSVLDFSGTDSFSISLWTNLDSNSSSTLISSWGGNNPWIILRTQDTDDTHFRLRDSSGNDNSADWGDQISTGSWTHVVGTHDGDTQTVKLYVDTDLKAQNQNTNSTNDLVQTDWHIGNRAFENSENTDGAISDVRFFNRTLLPGAVKYLHENPLAGYIVKPR